MLRVTSPDFSLENACPAIKGNDTPGQKRVAFFLHEFQKIGWKSSWNLVHLRGCRASRASTSQPRRHAVSEVRLFGNRPMSRSRGPAEHWSSNGELVKQFRTVSGQRIVWSLSWIGFEMMLEKNKMRFLWFKHELPFSKSFRRSCWFLLAYVFCSVNPLRVEMHMTAAHVSEVTSQHIRWRIRQEHRGLALQNLTFDWFSEHITDASWYEILGNFEMVNPSPIWKFLLIYHVTKYWYTDIGVS